LSSFAELLSRLAIAFGPRVQAELLISGLLAGAALLLFSIRPELFIAPLAAFQRLANRRVLSLVVVALFPVIVRLLWLPWHGIPEPGNHDENVHMLAADTILHGRLANPPHPFWPHFETIYVLQQPSYSSSYPLGQGLLYALGILLTGHPWSGVLLSVALMAASISWMLRAWFVPSLAMLGGLIAGAVFGVATTWVNSYWGGALASAAGACMIGAAVRWSHSLRPAFALIGVASWSLLWLIRPYESVCLAVPLGVALLVRLRSIPSPWPHKLRRFLLPILCMLLPVAAFTALHNWRVTGSFIKLPYQLSRELYGVPQTLLIQAPAPKPPLRFEPLEGVYNWQLAARMEMNSIGPFLYRLPSKAYDLAAFYVDYNFLIPLMLIPWVRLPHRWLLISLCAAFFAGNALYPFFFTHYAAALAGIVVLFAIAGARLLWTWRPARLPAGRLLVAVLLVSVALRPLRFYFIDRFQPVQLPTYTRRSDIVARLKQTGPKHLVFVRYSSHHNAYFEIVYNRADIDASDIVWARPIDPSSDAALVSYYGNRRVWILEPDEKPPRLYPYTPPAPDGE
jgi:hypothetical protein